VRKKGKLSRIKPESSFIIGGGGREERDVRRGEGSKRIGKKNKREAREGGIRDSWLTGERESIHTEDMPQ